MAAIGALFAFSFDTLSQASLFAVARQPVWWLDDGALAGESVCRRHAAVGRLNGIWISRLIRRSDETAMSLRGSAVNAVSAVSLLTAAFGASKLLLPQLDAWAEGKELWLGAFVMLVIFTSFLLGDAAGTQAGREAG